MKRNREHGAEHQLSEDEALGENDDYLSCAICLSPLSVNGEHQSAALSCGHVFGKSCVLKWLRQHRGQKRACPNCRAPVKVSVLDIHIPAKGRYLNDTTEILELKRKMERETKDRVKAEFELSNAVRGQATKVVPRIAKPTIVREPCPVTLRELNACKRRVRELEAELVSCENLITSLRRPIEVALQGGRVAATLDSELLVVSHGAELLCVDNQTGGVMARIDGLHEGKIMDIKMCSGKVLTCSADRSVLLSQIGLMAPRLQRLQRWVCTSPVWSTAMLTYADNLSLILCGQADGRVTLFDLATTNESSSGQVLCTGLGPVHSIHVLSSSTVLIGGLKGAWLGRVEYPLGHQVRKPNLQLTSLLSTESAGTGPVECCGAKPIENENRVVVSLRSTSRSRAQHLIVRVDIENHEDKEVVAKVGGHECRKIFTRVAFVRRGNNAFLYSADQQRGRLVAWDLIAAAESESTWFEDFTVVPQSGINGVVSDLVHYESASGSKMVIVSPDKMVLLRI